MHHSDLTDEELDGFDDGRSLPHSTWLRASAEIRRQRAVMARLREMALCLEYGLSTDLGSIGAELRARINGA